MKLELRPYQAEAVDAIWDYLHDKEGDSLIVLPTATGKSLVIAEIIKRLADAYPGARGIVGTHVKELVEQNMLEFYGQHPEIPCGIYSAGLNQRDLDSQIIFGGIQSMYRRALEFGRVNFLLVDEAHLIPHKGEGMWRTFIEMLRKVNPRMRVIGLTATPFRMDSGLLHKGKGAIFDDICYEYPLLQAIEEGYVCPVVPKNMDTTYDITGVKKAGGEYKPGELQKAINIEDKTYHALDEVVSYGIGSDPNDWARKAWLIFAAGNEHAAAIQANLEERRIKSRLVLQDTSAKERAEAVRDLKEGRIQCLVNNLIFTTGFNAPNVDLIACFRPTQSSGLWVQMVGRGFRLHPDKEDCLILDFARNADRHGPLDLISGTARSGEGGGGEAPVKVCPACNSVCFAGSRYCPDCNHEFPPKEVEEKIQREASTTAITSDQVEPVWHDIMTTGYSLHQAKGKPHPVMKVEHWTLYGDKFYEWVCFEHPEGNFAKRKAKEWHRKRRVHESVGVPATVNHALNVAYRKVKRIKVKKNGKYWNVVGAELEPLEEAQARDAGNQKFAEELEEIIPF